MPNTYQYYIVDFVGNKLQVNYFDDKIKM